ncbi:hypothetical protein GW17_00037341, partial [Ensete ventricosum]
GGGGDKEEKGDKMSDEEGKSKGQYGTFSGAQDYAQPAIGFPQPVPPPGLTAAHPPPPTPPQQSGPTYYAHGYQAVPGMLLYFTDSRRFAQITSSVVVCWVLDPSSSHLVSWVVCDLMHE